MKNLTKTLWYIYGYVYDGLLSFYPYKELINDVYTKVECKKGDTVLELGCGTGNIILKFSGKDLKLTGVDLSSSMLQVAKNKAKKSGSDVSFIESGMVAFLETQQNESVDHVILCNALYTLHPKERTKFWKELKRVLKNGADVVIANPDQPGSKSLTKYHLQNDKWYKLISPKMLAVGFIDSLIDLFASKGSFELQSHESLLKEAKTLGLVEDLGRTYGGDKGIDVLLRVTKHSS